MDESCGQHLAPDWAAVRKARSRALAPSSGFGYSTGTQVSAEGEKTNHTSRHEEKHKIFYLEQLAEVIRSNYSNELWSKL